MYPVHHEPPEIASLRNENLDLRGLLNSAKIQLQLISVLTNEAQVRTSAARFLDLMERRGL